MISGSQPRADEAGGELHREARGVRRGDQLLGARLAVRPRTRDCQVTSSSGSTPRRRRDDPAPHRRCNPPIHSTSALRVVGHLRHHLHSSICRREPALAIQHFPQRADRHLELVERRLARRQALQPEPRREQRSSERGCRRACRRSGSARRRCRRSAAGSAIARDDQPVPGQPAEEREDEDADHHHPEAGTRCRSAGGSASSAARSRASAPRRPRRR